MDWLDFDTGTCSIQRTLRVVGEKWTMLILREAFNGVRRFDQIRNHVGVSDGVLADRLRKLVAAGVLTAVPYREPGRRERNEYRLTEIGLELYPILIGLLNWGDRHLVGPEGPTVEVSHGGCGAALRAVVACDDGHVLNSAREVHVAPGPGFVQAGTRRNLSPET